MADGELTSTITITGTVNGRKINVTSTMTMENVYDAGIAQAGASEASYSSIGMGADRPLSFEQNCPSYLFSVNRSTCETGMASLSDAGASTVFSLVIPPGGFIILNEDSNGAGMITLSTTATNITLGTVSVASVDRIPDIGFVVKVDNMVAFEAAS